MKKIFLSLAVIFTATVCANAQVTIGSGDEPQPFSLLELISNGNKGMRLPQLTTLQRKALSDTHGTQETIKGLTVYNTIKNCVEYWNGTEWIPVGTCQPVVEIPAITACSQSIPPVFFMAYNLGADPTLDTPKKQMNYLAAHAFNALDANIYGGWFQWGRGYISDQAEAEQNKVGWKHAVDLSNLPVRLRYDGESNAYTAIGGGLGSGSC
ncbi:MAG: hypothetical protein LBT04_08050 [Prevotellaceae bacterium]|nr:hypothetical protein [Prevotellaceae bacterium]